MNAKIIVAIILTCLALYALFSYLHMRRLIDLGNEIAANAVPFARETKSDMKILVIGDSTAVGTGAEAPEGSVAGRIGQDYPKASIENLGVNGSKTHELIPRLQALEEKQTYDLILVQVGGNDILRNTPLSKLSDSIDTVLAEATKRAEHVILMSTGDVGTSYLLPIGSKWFFTWKTKRVRALFIATTEKYDAHYIDLFKLKDMDPFVQDPEKYYANDYLHPSSEGYATWYGELGPVVHSLLDT